LFLIVTRETTVYMYICVTI